MPPLTIAVETASGTVRGDGPIITASRFARTVQLDKAGDNRFAMPASDPRTLLIRDPDIHRYIRAQTRRGHTPRAEVGYGVVGSLNINSETQTLEASGPDVLDELTRTTVGTLFLHGAGDDDPIAAADVLPAIMAYALPGWTITGTPSKDVDPYQFGDESVLAALGKIADILGDHWRLSETVDRQIEWLPTTEDGFVPVASGVRAIDYGETTALESNPDVCLIVGGLQEAKDSTERCTRIKPRGGGNAGAALYLNGTTRIAPAGFTLHIDANPEKSYIAYDAAEVSPADVIEHTERFGDIAPITETSAANIAAANQLFDAALVWLRRHIRAQHAYNLRVTKLHRRLRVGDSIHVQCRHKTDGFGWIWVNRHLMVLSKSETFEALGGEPVVDLEVTDATNDRYPMSDRNLLATEVIRLRDQASHVQVAARAQAADGVADGVTISTSQTISGAKLFSGALDRRTDQNAITVVSVGNLIALGNTSAAAQLLVSATGVAGFIGAYPADHTVTRYRDRFVVATTSTSSDLILDAASATQAIRMFAGSGTEKARLSASGMLLATSLALPIVTKTAAYTLGANDYTVLGNATTGIFNLTLPTAVGIDGRIYTLKKIDSSVNAVTVVTTSSQTIDGATTYALSTQWKYVTVQSDGANWRITGNN